MPPRALQALWPESSSCEPLAQRFLPPPVQLSAGQGDKAAPTAHPRPRRAVGATGRRAGVSAALIKPWPVGPARPSLNA